jgi:hypothetical protein
MMKVSLVNAKRWKKKMVKQITRLRVRNPEQESRTYLCILATDDLMVVSPLARGCEVVETSAGIVSSDSPGASAGIPILSPVRSGDCAGRGASSVGFNVSLKKKMATSVKAHDANAMLNISGRECWLSQNATSGPVNDVNHNKAVRR